MIAFNFSLRALLFTALLTLTGGAPLQAGKPFSLPSGLGMPEAVATDPNFITRWDLQPGETEIRVNLERADAVDYTWETVPAASSGFGTFAAGSGEVTVSGLPAGATIRLSIAPDNLRRIFSSFHAPSRQAFVDVENWGSTQWTNMLNAFSGCVSLTGFSALDAPDLSQVSSTWGMFSSTPFNSAIGHWDVSNVSDMSFMFNQASAFNQNLNDWDVSNVTTMTAMFRGAAAFNGSIEDWDVSHVEDMTDLFLNAANFNQNISGWDVSGVESMLNMFNGATVFNQPIGNWNTSMVTTMSNMFNGATSFNQPIGNWTLNLSVNLSNMLINSGMDCANYSATLIGWSNNPATPNNRSLGATGMEYGTNAAAARANLIGKSWTISGDGAAAGPCESINTDNFITEWTFPAAATQIRFNALTEGGAVNYTWTASPSGSSGNGSFTQATAGAVTLTGLTIEADDVVTLSMAPENLRRFYINNGTDRQRLADVLQWGTVDWTSMESAFRGCSNLNISATDVPDLSEVSSMAEMFRSCTTLNGPANIGTWDTGAVMNMSGMFRSAIAFNQPIGDWNTEAVTNMSYMFNSAEAFNQPIGDWDTGSVTNMISTFSFAFSFNQPIGAWNTEGVTNMASMFENAIAFNEPIGNWDTELVTNMFGMFRRASAFNQAIGNWPLNSNVSMVNMLSDSGLDCENYSATLIGWAGNNPTVTGRSLGANGLQYGTNATAARDLLTGTRGWTISGDSPASGTCFNADDFITEWTFPADATQIRFNALTEGGAIDYTWTASPSGNSGDGSFTQATAGAVTISGLTIAAGDVVTLSMAPENLRRFYINFGQDRARLTDVLQWGTVGWTSMQDAFHGCINLNITAIDIPDLSGVTNAVSMFQECRELNGPSNINDWETGAITNMSSLFRNARAFNQPIGDWNTAAVTDMSFLFFNAVLFNQPIGEWETGAVTDMAGMFGSARAFNQSIGEWETGAVTNMRSVFSNAESFNQPIGDWETGAVTNMQDMFGGAKDFNQPIGDWNTASVTDMLYMFDRAESFNQPIGEWETGSVTRMAYMFSNAEAFNQPIGEWETGAVTDMSNMFVGAEAFNQPIGEWETGAVTNMSSMFNRATAFNQPIGEWETGSVTNMASLFRGATAFNQPIGEWETGAVTEMTSMFDNAIAFNQPIGDWQTAAVTDMSFLFFEAPAFNQPIGNWNTEAVENMTFMFRKAEAFNQPIGSWTLNPNVDMATMLSTSGLDCANYSATLIGWAGNNPTVTNRNLGADGLQYGTNATAARDLLTGTRGWTISGDSPASGTCFDADDFITHWTFPNAATQIRFNALTEGGAVDYTWTASPSGNSGSGSFTQAAAGAVTLSGLSIASGDVVTLSMAPEHLRRFYINNGPDRERLTDVLQWGTVGWTSMSSAFRGCSNLNITATDIPNLSGVSSMAGMFRSCTTLNGPANIGTWNTGTVTDMSGLFFFAIDFNQPIGGWNTGTVETMDFMFRDAEDFNQPIGDWETGMVTNMGNMLNGASAFNQPIGDWDTGMVTDMAGMFQGATAFDQPIGDWNTGAVSSMSNMFRDATAFNQPIGTWNTGEVRNMSDMFQGATAFNYPVGTWTLNSSVSLFNTLSNSGMDCANYSATLIGWSNNPATPNGRSLMADGLQYGTNATAARDLLTGTRGWTISGDSPASGTCFDADDFITHWTFPNAATQIRFNALTEGGAVDYTWTASPSGNSGNGSFTQAAAGAVTLSGLSIAAGDVVTLSMAPENLRRFYINNGADRERLTDVLQWGAVGWTSMSSAFRGCSNLNITATDIPDLSVVSNMRLMFLNCSILNGPANIGNWNTGTVTEMSQLFRDASNFNQPIGDWDTGEVTDMNQMFRDASSFNQPIGDWNTGAVTSMSGMFDGATAFNQPIEDWDVSQVLQMGSMFENASAFNTALNEWDVSKVENMFAMFQDASSFNQNINDWDVSEVENMGLMFQGATNFNQNISDWDVSSVFNMSNMFRDATNFNQNINDWDVSSVDRIFNMFRGATNFNQSLNDWDVSNVSEMQGMFQYATAFNGEIQNWDVSGVTEMSLMFEGTVSFNQPLDNWNVSNVIGMIQMFNQASNFNQSLGSWTLNPNALMFNMLNDSGLDCQNYSATLIGWSINPATPDGRSLGADGMQYGTNAEAARDNLLSKGWTINGDAPSGIPCTDFALSGNIVWEYDLSTPVPDATVALSGDDSGSDDTDANGDYAIPTAGGNSLTLTPAKTTGNPYDGVDAADVTRIQQHVTFIDRFDDGYKAIAADVNQSNSVTGLDAAIVFHALNGNSAAQAIFEAPSWHFVDSTHTFMDENNPWPFPDTIALMNVMADVLNQSFVGVKMGDVNGTWGVPLAPLAAPLNWTLPNQTLKAGQRIRVPFRANGLPDVAAWQFALRFDTDYLRFERALPTAAFPLKDENFGAWQAEQGELRSVFAVPQGLVLPKDEAIFELEFKVVRSGLSLSEVLRLDNGILDGRVYNTALNGGAVALTFEAVETRRIASLLPGEATLGFALEQNIPNPFGNETLIRFQLPDAGEVFFSVHDVQGRLLYEQRGFFDAGLHEVRLDAARLGAVGVLSYTLRSGAHSATRRMVVVRR